MFILVSWILSFVFTARSDYTSQMYCLLWTTYLWWISHQRYDWKAFLNKQLHNYHASCSWPRWGSGGSFGVQMIILTLDQCWIVSSSILNRTCATKTASSLQMMFIIKERNTLAVHIDPGCRWKRKHHALWTNNNLAYLGRSIKYDEWQL